MQREMANSENIAKHKFKPGQSGNPKGKAKGTISTKTIIRKWLQSKEKTENPITGKIQILTVLDIITLALIKRAKKGDAKAFSVLLDRMEGKPKQELGLTDNDGNDIFLGYGKEED